MKTIAKVGGYVTGLGIVFAAAFGVGIAVGPVGPAADRTEPAGQTDPHPGGMDMEHGAGQGG